MSKDQQHCCAARLAAGMPIDRCGCEEWVEVQKGKGGRPACSIPMTVKDAAGKSNLVIGKNSIASSCKIKHNHVLCLEISNETPSSGDHVAARIL